MSWNWSWEVAGLEIELIEAEAHVAELRDALEEARLLAHLATNTDEEGGPQRQGANC